MSSNWPYKIRKKSAILSRKTNICKQEKRMQNLVCKNKEIKNTIFLTVKFLIILPLPLSIYFESLYNRYLVNILTCMNPCEKAKPIIITTLAVFCTWALWCEKHFFGRALDTTIIKIWCSAKYPPDRLRNFKNFFLDLQANKQQRI